MVRYQPGLATEFIGDAGRCRQVITNLLGNAVKFTDKGYVLVEVNGKERGEHCDVEIKVVDTGCGIPDDKLHTIFEEFEQVDGSNVRQHDGTGLGLAITKRIVGGMGGTVDAQSTLGAGSTFTVNLRLKIDEKAQPKPLDNKTALANTHACIIDDNPLNRKILLECIYHD